MYFAYLLVLKAVIKTEPYWQSYQFYTGNKTEDVETRNMVMEIIQAAKLVIKLVNNYIVSVPGSPFSVLCHRFNMIKYGRNKEGKL